MRCMTTRRKGSGLNTSSMVTVKLCQAETSAFLVQGTLEGQVRKTVHVNVLLLWLA